MYNKLNNAKMHVSETAYEGHAYGPYLHVNFQQVLCCGREFFASQT